MLSPPWCMKLVQDALGLELDGVRQLPARVQDALGLELGGLACEKPDLARFSALISFLPCAKRE